MATVPRIQRAVSARTGASGAGRIDPGAFSGLAQAGEEFAAAAGEAVQAVFVEPGLREEAEQTEREENEWITATTASSVEQWTLGFEEAKKTAGEGAPEFTPNFMGGYDEWLTGVLDGAPSQRARDDISSRLGLLRDRLVVKSIDFEGRAGRAQRLSSFTSAMDNYSASAAIDSVQVPALIAAASGDLAAAESTWMLPEQVTEFRSAIAPNIAAAGLQGDILKDPQAVLDQINDSEPGDGSIAGLLTADQRTKLASAARSEINSNKTTVAIQKNALKIEMGDIEAIHSAGLEAGTERMKILRQNVDLIGDPSMQKRLRNLEQQGVASKEYRTWQPGNLQNFINEKRSSLAGREASQADAMLITTAEDMLSEMNTVLRDDPLIWAIRAGQNVPPVSFFGDDAIASMRARRDMSIGFAGDYGIQPRFLTNEDERQLASILSKSEAQDKAVILANIVEGFGPEATEIFSRVSKDNRLMAHAGGLTVEGPVQAKAAVEIINGNESIKAGIDVLPGASEINQWTGEYLNGSLSMVPATMGSVIEAAKAIYTDRAIKSPPEDGDGQRDLWEKSMDAALGGFDVDSTFSTTTVGSVGNWNGFGVVLPNNIGNARFASLINSVNEEDLKAASVGGAAPIINDRTRQPLTADQFRKARFSSIGEGQYLVDLTHVGVDFALGSGPSGRYVFDLTRIMPALNLRADVIEEQSEMDRDTQLRRALQRGGQSAVPLPGPEAGFGRVR